MTIFQQIGFVFRGLPGLAPFRYLAVLILLLFISQPILAQDSIELDPVVLPNAGVELVNNKVLSDTDLECYPGISPLPGTRSGAGQRGTRRRKAFVHPVGVGMNLYGPTLYYGSVFLQYYFGENFQLEAGSDLRAVYGGFNIYPPIRMWSPKVAPYMGFYLGYVDPDRTESNKGIYAYMPVGIRYVTRDKLMVAFELAATTSEENVLGPYVAGIRLGYLFTR